MARAAGERHILAIDSGTTGTTVLVLDGKGEMVGRGYAELPQIYPRPGWVEHDPESIWRAALDAIDQALRSSDVDGTNIAAIGVTNQRETTILWDAKTGLPVHNAIVWQCRRTADICTRLRAQGHEPVFRRKTGLLLDPYFSGTKVRWLLDESRDLSRRAAKGEILFGTVDTWLVWKLTGGTSHVTDATNASRTLLYDIFRHRWDDGLLDLLGVPRAMLPEVRPSASPFGAVKGLSLLPAGPPVLGIAGDQQAALYGQGCFRAGEAKNTYGTGCFLLMNTGDRAVRSKAGLLTTLAAGPKGEPVYALEGAVFIAGAAVQWLRDGLGLIASAGETDRIARSVPSTDGVFFIPAFTGLGAPYWDPDARGAILGITRGTSRAHLVRAALESMAYQTHEVLECMARESGISLRELRVDGGASSNDFLMQFQSDVSGVPVDRPAMVESTALGAAYLAGVQSGLWSPADLARIRRTEGRFRPKMKPAQRDALLSGWRAAVERVLARTGRPGKHEPPRPKRSARPAAGSRKRSP